MSMTLSLHDHPDFAEQPISIESVHSQSGPSGGRNSDVQHFFSQKVEIPRLRNIVVRPRLIELMDRAVRNFSATLISGRAGTGKTVLAAQYSAAYARNSWYTLDATDSDWEVFSRYFAKSLSVKVDAPRLPDPAVVDEEAQTLMSEFIVECLAKCGENAGKKPSLIVLDGLHHVFDAHWFRDFFHLLVYSLLPGMHLILISRSRPPAPLWRLRSKQMLNVIDERLLVFGTSETEDLCRIYGLPPETAREVLYGTFGRISNILKAIELRVPSVFLNSGSLENPPEM